MLIRDEHLSRLSPHLWLIPGFAPLFLHGAPHDAPHDALHGGALHGAPRAAPFHGVHLHLRALNEASPAPLSSALLLSPSFLLQSPALLPPLVLLFLLPLAFRFPLPSLRSALALLQLVRLVQVKFHFLFSQRRRQ